MPWSRELLLSRPRDPRMAESGQRAKAQLPESPTLMPDRAPSRSSRPVRNDRHCCETCGRTYSRRDHLARHLQSHTSQRPFLCLHCGKGFARGDLLTRHTAIHAVDYTRLGNDASSRFTRACSPCAKAKAKCGNEKPCRRCITRGLSCTPTSGQSPVENVSHVPAGQSRAPGGLSSEVETGVPRNASLAGDAMVSREAQFSPLLFEDETNPLMDDNMGDLPWYMMSTPLAIQSHDALGLFQADLSSEVGPGPGLPFDEMLRETFGDIDEWESLISTGKIRRANEAFQESLWYSVPDHPHTDQDCIDHDLSSSSGDDESEVLAYELCLSVPERFDPSTRDSLFVDLVLYAHSHLPSMLTILRAGFPSVRLLNTLVHLFLIKQDGKVDSWIHSASFRPTSFNVELTAMILAAASVRCTPFPGLHKLGKNLRRLLRPIILNKLENDHNASSKLQLYQALLLSLELDLWHDDEVCLNRAGRFSSIIATFMRQELQDRKSDMTTFPLSTDSPAETARKWQVWIAAESYKRLITRFYIYDTQLSMTLGTRALTSPSEYCLPVPQPKSLWLASSPMEWKQIYLSQHATFSPRVMDLLTAIPTISVTHGSIDRDLAMKVIFHLIGGLIKEFQLSPHANPRFEADTENSWRKELEAAIKNFDLVFNRDIRHSHIGSFVVAYLSMTLKVSVRNIEILAGKVGEHESRAMYQTMKGWTDTTAAREAIWHAGQVLRLFQLIERLTSFQIIIAYQSVLVLFAFSVLSSVRDAPAATHCWSVLCLNDSSSDQLNDFIDHGFYEPILRRDDQGTVSLLDTKQAVDVTSEIILNRACSCGDLSPRLVNGLVTLLKDLASAIQTFRHGQFPPEF